MKNFAAVIGNFDGIHKGHQYVFETLRDIAHRHGLKTMAITFDTHPRQVFDPDFKPSFLTTLEERATILKEYVDEVKILHFDRAFASITARDFMEHQLRDGLGVKILLLGYDNRFGKRTPSSACLTEGKNQEENFESYRDYGKELGIEVLLAEPVDVSGLRVSSSQVRHAVMAGRMEEVTETLGRTYSISGTVVAGHQEGRRIGFPTANILPQEGKIMPPYGVYATKVDIDGREYQAMTNIGERPTFNGSGITIESNIFDFNEDIYGKTITVSFLHYLRPEQKFSSVDALTEQMKIDKEQII